MTNVILKPAVVETVEHVVEPEKVVIELTKSEAEVLAAVLCRIGGAPSGPRGVTQSILDSLADIEGVRTSTSDSGWNGEVNPWYYDLGRDFYFNSEVFIP